MEDEKKTYWYRIKNKKKMKKSNDENSYIISGDIYLPLIVLE
jgi:hypothetical protein